MENKGLDTTFIHYGIRKEDMDIIKNLCEEQNINFDWLCDNILKEYHSIKVNNEDEDDKNIKKIFTNALNQ